MAKLLEWEKRLKQAVANQHKIGWSVREKRGKCLIQRYWKDTGTYERKVIPIAWESDQLLNILNSLKEISDLMINTKCTLAEATKILFPENKNKPITNWQYLTDEYKKYKQESKNIKDSTWNGVYLVTLKRIIRMMSEDLPPVSGKGILQRLMYNDNGSLTVSKGRVKRIETGKTFLEWCVNRKGLNERFLPPSSIDLKELKGIGARKDDSNNSGRAERIEDDQLLLLLDSFPDTDSGRRWRLATGLLICFGLRCVELNYCKPKGDVLEISYSKQSSKGSTRPRDVEGLSPAAKPYLHEELLLQLSSGITALPPLGAEDKHAARSFIRALQRNKFWQKLEADAAAVGKTISTYSFRHQYCFRGAVLGGLDADFLAENMGHSLATHLQSYRNFYLDKVKKKRFEEARKRMSENYN